MSGLKTLMDVKKAARIFARKVQKAGYCKARLSLLTIQNIALSVKCPWRLDITKLPLFLKSKIDFGESADVATVRGEGSRRTRYFYTGSIIMTGYKDINEANVDYWIDVLPVTEKIKQCLMI